MTISEYFFSFVKEEISNKTPNKETLASMKEVDEGGGDSFTSLEDFWKQMGIDPNAEVENFPRILKRFKDE